MKSWQYPGICAVSSNREQQQGHAQKHKRYTHKCNAKKCKGKKRDANARSMPMKKNLLLACKDIHATTKTKSPPIRI